MKISPLLLASLVSTAALVATVIVFVEGERDIQTSTTPAVDAGAVPANSSLPAKYGSTRPSGGVADKVRLSTSTRSADRSPANRPRSSAANNFPSAAASAIAAPDAPQSAAPDFKATGPAEMRSRQAPSSARRIPKWVTHPQAAILLQSGERPVEASSAVAGEQATVPIPPFVRSPEPIAHAAPAVPIGSAVLMPRLVAAEPANQSPWPKGPFTSEEELYRAQYGAAAFSAVLREDALGPVNP